VYATHAYPPKVAMGLAPAAGLGVRPKSTQGIAFETIQLVGFRQKSWSLFHMERAEES
jgi:hypothetical protein